VPVDVAGLLLHEDAGVLGVDGVVRPEARPLTSSSIPVTTPSMVTVRPTREISPRALDIVYRQDQWRRRRRHVLKLPEPGETRPRATMAKTRHIYRFLLKEIRLYGSAHRLPDH